VNPKLHEVTQLPALRNCPDGQTQTPLNGVEGGGQKDWQVKPFQYKLLAH
jgi:hypothetical protein